MAKNNNKPALFVVDGSNIATEGRSQPSLEQLNEAVAAFEDEYPHVKVTVVVDATFGHRIAKKEVKAFDAAVAKNELVTPPAGAVGRGDAFILAIAHKANAGVFSNDSFQEFHGDYEWLFDPGRLIGGKPVPHVGWVFVDRNPVRGPKSRESIKAAKHAAGADSDPTEAKEQARRRIRKKGAARSAAEPAEAPAAEERSAAGGSATTGEADGGAQMSKGEHVNDLVAFLEFVEHHAVGTHVSGEVDRYSSHGAYTKVDDVLVYVPLRLMADPPPTSARKVVQLGDMVDLVVMAFNPERRSIDAALASMAGSAVSDTPAASAAAESADPSSKKRRSSRRRGKKSAADAGSSGAQAPADRPSAGETGAPTADAVDGKQSGAPEAGVARGSGSTSAKLPPAKKRAAKQAAARKQATRKKQAAATPVADAPADTDTARKKRPAKKKAAAKKRADQATDRPAAKTQAAKQAPAKKRAAPKKAAKKAAASGEAGS